jgi:hypothetical protein
MITVPPERLRKVGIQHEIYLRVEPDSSLIHSLTCGVVAVVVTYLFLHILRMC